MQENDNKYQEENEDDLLYSLPEEEEDILEDGGSDLPPSRNPLKLLFKLLGTPVEGWKEIKRSQCTASTFAWGCFYPLTLLAALTQFMDLFYDPDVSLAHIVAIAVMTFMSLLLGYFCALVVSNVALPTYVRIHLETQFGKIFMMAMISILAMTMIVWNLFPFLSPLLSFIPIYIVYLIVRGVKYLRVNKEETGKVTMVLCVLLIGLPLLLKLFFSELAPQ